MQGAPWLQLDLTLSLQLFGPPHPASSLLSEAQGCPSHEQPVSQENALGNVVKGCLASVQHRTDLIPLKPLTCCGWSLGTPFFPVYRLCHCPSTRLDCILVSRLWWKKGTGDRVCSPGSRKAASSA